MGERKDRNRIGCSGASYLLPRCRGGIDRERPTDGERVCVLYCLRERDLREWIYVESGRAAAACGRGHGDAEPGRRVT